MAVDHLLAFDREAARFVEVLGVADLGAHVSACPDWDVRALAGHLGGVFDFFTTIVAKRLTEREQIRDVVRDSPPDADAELARWVGTKVAGLRDQLAGLGPDEPVWNFSTAPHVGAWVSRRMLHETLVHRFDVEAAAGLERAPTSDEVLLDGVDEFFTTIATAGTRWDEDAPATLRAEVDDRAWAIRLVPGERAEVGVDGADADVVVAGSAAAMLDAAWARGPVDGLVTVGSPERARTLLAAVAR